MAYTRDKDCRLSFRVNQALYDWVAQRANKLGVSPCDFARSTLFQSMAAEVMLKEIDNPNKAVIAKKGRHENSKVHK